jgi:hypothetical protein
VPSFALPFCCRCLQRDSTFLGRGYSVKLLVLLHTVTLVATGMGIVIVLPASLVWITVACWRRWRGVAERFSATPVMTVCLVGVALASVTVVRDFTRRAAWERAIRRAAPL